MKERVSLSGRIQGDRSPLVEAVKFDYGDKARKARGRHPPHRGGRFLLNQPLSACSNYMYSSQLFIGNERLLSTQIEGGKVHEKSCDDGMAQMGYESGTPKLG